MEFTRLEGAFGACVTGVDLTRPIDRETLDRLIEAFYSVKLMVFPGQKLSMEAYENFARQWGELYIETYENMAVPGHPAIMEVGNTGPVLEAEAYRNGAAFWHTDRAYAPDCNAITMLYCIHAPATGGETHFADLVAAYNALDDETRARIEDVVATHRYGGGDREDWEFEVHPMVPGQEETLPIGRQPLVRRHDITGKRGLYSVAGTWHEVEGMDHEAARTLMRSLKLHAIEPRFTTTHSYSPGDLVMWDNTQTLHAAAPIGPAIDEASKRLLRRIVVTGLPPFVEAYRQAG